jgi:transposase
MPATDEELLRLPAKELVAIIRRLERRIAEQDKQIAALIEGMEKLTKAVRESHRGNAPFSKGRSKPDPKKPGRRAGKGNFARRPEPEPTPADEVHDIDVPLDVDQRLCPECGVPLDTADEQVSVEDVAPVPRRVIKRFSVEVGTCPLCGRRVRGSHPDIGQHQSGANAHQVGPNAIAQGLALHYQSGLPLRKVPHVIAQHTGIKISQSALTQAAGRLSHNGGIMERHYDALRGEIRHSAVVNTDDTGWRIGTALVFLMGFFTRRTAVYQVRGQHRHQEVMEVIGTSFTGLLGTDRGSSYEAQGFDDVQMQKCLSHILKNLSMVEETKTGRAKAFSTQLKATLREGIVLWRQMQDGRLDRAGYFARAEELDDRLTHQLRGRILSDADNQRMLDGIGRQHERGRLTLFLLHPEIEPTNNRAERGLRPAVIARKVSQCSKNQRGAHTYEVLKSVFTTLALRTQNATRSFAGLLRGEAFPA